MGCGSDPLAAIGHAAEREPAGEREPGRHGPLRRPRRCPQRRRPRELRPAAVAASSELGEGDGCDRGGCERPSGSPSSAALRQGRCERELEGEPPRLGQRVVRLPDPLGQEVRGGRGAAGDVETRSTANHATHRFDGADELEVLEEAVAVVAPGARQRGPADDERARPVAAEGAVQERTGGVPPGVPGLRVEHVLGEHDVGAVEEGHGRTQHRRRVAHVVVGDHDRFVLGPAHARQHAVHLAEGEREVGVDPDVVDPWRKCSSVGAEHRPRRPVDHQHLDMPDEGGEVGAQLGCFRRVAALDGEDVGAGRGHAAIDTAVSSELSPVCHERSR